MTIMLRRILPVLVLVVTGMHAQSGKVIELRSADKLERTVIGGEDVRDFSGHVYFVQPSDSGGPVRLWCDRALQFMKSGRIECFGNVKIIRDNMTLLSSEGTYFDKTQRATMRKGVRLERPGSILTSTQGDYEADRKRAHFTGDVVVRDSVSTTTCDDLTYYDTDERSIAVGNVIVRSLRDGVTVYGDSLVHLGAIDYTLVPSNPKLVQVDTSAVGNLDTLVVVSRIMEAFRDTSQRYVARDSVMLVRNEMASTCGHGVYRPQEGLLILTQHPVVWYDKNQVTGDSIAVRLEEHRLKSVFVEGRAMAVSRSDSVLLERFDQLTGRSLTLYFGESDIERIVAEQQSISLYYLYDNLDPNGVNRSSGDRIVVDFREGQVDQINVTGGVQGQYVPENLVVGREPGLNLDGFQWYIHRPKRNKTEIVFDHED